MISNILNFFRDEEDNNPSFIQMTRNILFFVIAVNVLILPLVIGLFGEGSRNITALIALTATLILEGISLFLVYQKKVGMAKLIVPSALIVAITIIALTTNGLRDISFIGFPIVIVVAVLLMGKRAVWTITPLTIIAVEIVAISDFRSGRVATKVGIDDALIVAVLLLGCSSILQVLVGRLNESLAKARESERIQFERVIELDELRQSLDKRVEQRTSELAAANQHNLRRARQFEAISQVVRAISSIQDLNSLLPEITSVISRQFGHYHAAIYLLDEKREYAVLRATNSEGGKKMLLQDSKLAIGQTSIIGYVAASGQPRIAQDVDKDANFFNEPNLPDTRSEIALPLRFAGQLIGVLDVQSLENNAFELDDVESLNTLADQVSIAINNSITLEQARQALAVNQSSYNESAQESWKIMRPRSLGIGFELSGGRTKPLEKPLEGDHIREAFTKGESVISDKESSSSSLAVPIRLRGQVIGIMNLSARQNFKLSDDSIDIAEAIAERLSLAIETATLLQTAQHRADIERITTDISSKISSSTHFETILQVAAQELSRALGGSDVIVQIEPASIELGMTN